MHSKLWTYLESREVLLHVSPAEQPHLVVRSVIVKLHWIRVSADCLEGDTQSNQSFKDSRATE